MLRFLAKIWARWNYIFQLEFESAKSEVNARLAERNTNEKRMLVDRLNKEADDIEKRIEEMKVMEEKGYWLCENGHEKTVTCDCAGNSGLAVVHTVDCPLSDDVTEDGQPVTRPAVLRS